MKPFVPVVDPKLEVSISVVEVIVDGYVVESEIALYAEKNIQMSDS